MSSKYDPLREWLKKREIAGDRFVQVPFAEIEKIIGTTLPRSAKVHRAWWSNTAGSHVQGKSWLGARWITDEVDFRRKFVSFRKML